MKMKMRDERGGWTKWRKLLFVGYLALLIFGFTTGIVI